MKLFTHIFAIAAAVCIWGASLLFVTQTKLLNAKYITERAQTVDFYADLATALPAALSPGSGTQANVSRIALEQVITSGYTKVEFNRFLEQVQAYYFADGPAPKLDLSEIRQAAAQAGLELPAINEQSQVLTFRDPATKSFLAWLQPYGPWLPVAAGVLLALTALVSHPHRRFFHLGNAFLLAAAGEAVMAVLIKSVPSPLTAALLVNPLLKPLAKTFDKLSASLQQGASDQFLQFGLLLAAVCGLCYVLQVVAAAARKFRPHGAGGRAGHSAVRPVAGDSFSTHEE